MPETNNPCCNAFILLIIIFLTGIIGGVINYLTVEPGPKDKSSEGGKYLFNRQKAFYLQVLLGVCGASLIPLFLYLTSSKLFENCDSCFFTYFVFAGYCIIGAVFSRAILNSLSNKIFDLEKDIKTQKRELNEVKKEIQEQQREPENIIETKGEEIKVEIDRSGSLFNMNMDTYLKDRVNKDMETILEDLQKSKYKDRSISGISKTTKLPEDNVTVIIRAFIRAGLVQPVQWYGKTFYRLTDKGKQTKLVD